jgi:hypothetical protein
VISPQVLVCQFFNGLSAMFRKDDSVGSQPIDVQQLPYPTSVLGDVYTFARKIWPGGVEFEVREDYVATRVRGVRVVAMDDTGMIVGQSTANDLSDLRDTLKSLIVEPQK